jgi:hypothetical protein
MAGTRDDALTIAEQVGVAWVSAAAIISGTREFCPLPTGHCAPARALRRRRNPRQRSPPASGATRARVFMLVMVMTVLQTLT